MLNSPDSSSSPLLSQPTAREHSYLPSASLQILATAASDWSSTTASTAIHASATEPQASRPRYRPLAVLDMDIVVFPGDTLPIRFKERAWINHLTRQIAAAQRANASRGSAAGRQQQLVQFGVLSDNTPDPDARTRQRDLWTRRGGFRQSFNLQAQTGPAPLDGNLPPVFHWPVPPRTLRMASVNDHAAADAQDDDDDDDDENDSSSDPSQVHSIASERDTAVDASNGFIVPGNGEAVDEEDEQEDDDIDNPHERTDASNEPTNLVRRHAPRMVDMLASYSSALASAATYAPRGSMFGGNNDNASVHNDDGSHDSIPGLLSRDEINRQNSDDGSHDLLPPLISRDESYRRARNNERSESQSSHSSLPALMSRHDSDNTDDLSDETVRFRLPLPPRPPSNYGGFGALLQRLDAANFLMLSENSDRDSVPDSYSGRIGTIVSVLYSHDVGSESVDELILTAVGTSRFRIISTLDEDVVPRTRRFDTGRKLRNFMVEEMGEATLDLPMTAVASRFRKRQRLHANCMASVTPLPPYIFYKYSPWRLKESICEALEETRSLRGALTSLLHPNLFASGGLSRQLHDLHYFTYRLASNLPMSRHEKLEILEWDNVVFRLDCMYKKILQYKHTTIHCKRCDISLTKATHVFTLAGAGGTTGNYVNPHGCVYQTTTVLELDERRIRLSGAFSTRDSWFPGYGYHILSCCTCLSHLGWEFRLADDIEPTADRPKKFFGLVTTKIATHEPRHS